MTSDSSKQQNKNESKKKTTLFSLTRQQISDGVAKYDKAAAAVQAFNSVSFGESKFKERPLAFQKRLNSLDSTILEENAYKAIDDVDLQLEKKIENCEKMLKQIDEEINVADAVNDYEKKTALLNQKDVLAKNLESLKNYYTNQNIDTQITSVINDAISFPVKIRRAFEKQFALFIRSSGFLRKFKPLRRILEIRETLDKLNKINKSVDNLVSLKSPFGEQDVKYQTLINHLEQANALHSRIKRELNK